MTVTQHALPSSSSFSSFTYSWTYDVFLSFRGEDTRYNFTGNLYNSLHQRGINTFIDDEGLKRGEELTPALHKAIEESRIAIIVFSENYAYSTFCLEELVKILEQESRLVWPVFYKVDPSEVRHQRGSYGEALSKHQRKFKNDKDKMQKWKLALHDAANLSGWHFKPARQEYEYQFIERIVREVSTRLNRTLLHVANYPIGLESHVLKVNSLLKVGSNDEVNMVGIYGIGGIGKTTIARAIYNLIADQFEGLCFLANVREKSKYDLVQLQETLLSELVREHSIKLGDVSRGIPIIKHRLSKMKVLIILDDVDKIEQLQALAGGGDWFGPESRIIITTRDKHLLDIHGVKKIYEVRELNDDESLNLLCWNAFKSNELDPSYLDISNSIVNYAKGLPLALEIIGSNLFGKTIDEWNSLVDSYRRIPNLRVGEILKVSYDGLEENEQEVFLDIACFFKQHSLEYVMDMVQHAHGFNPSYAIKVLNDKSLLKVEEGYVIMHDLIQDMGREIVRKQSPKDPGKRSRLWSSEEIIHVLEEDRGTDRVEVIILDLPKNNMHIVHWSGKAFLKLKSLKILIIKNAYFSKAPEHLPNCLRVLEWWEYPSPTLPPDFHPKKLLVLNLKKSCFSSLKQIMANEFKNLSVMNFDSCELITQIPDVSFLPNLTEMSFIGCNNLFEVHDSVGFLNNLRILRTSQCFMSKFTTFPPLNLRTSLEVFELHFNPSLEASPEILGKMKEISDKKFSSLIQNLSEVRTSTMHGCKKIQLPVIFSMLPESNQLCMRSCRELQLSKHDECNQENGSLVAFPKMDRLVMEWCNMSNECLSIFLTLVANVKTLSLRFSSIFTIIPACIKECLFLTRLELDGCKHLREIRGLPPNIHYLSAMNCLLLSSQSTSMLLSQELHSAGGKMFSFPGGRVPEWFNHCIKVEGGSISLWFRNEFPCVTLCVVIGSTNYEKPFNVKFNPYVIINNGNKKFCASGIFGHSTTLSIVGDHIFVFDMQRIEFEDMVVEETSLKKEWNHVEVSFGKFVKESGIYVLKQKNKMEDIRFTNPYMDNEGNDM